MQNNADSPSRKLDVIIATYTAIGGGARLTASGPVAPMLRYFSRRTKNLFLLEQSLPGFDSLLPTLEWYRDGELYRKYELPRCLLWLYAIPPHKQNMDRTYVRLKIRDVISVIWAVLLARGKVKKIDLMIGVECVNAITLWICKKLFFIKAGIIYYLFDYCEKRYPSRLFNSFYLYLDKLATYRSDCTWNISKAIELSRIRRGLDETKMAKQATVNYGMFPDQLLFTDYDKCRKNMMVYAGELDWWSGLDLIIDAMPDLLRKCPELVLKIIGRGRKKAHYERRVKELGLEKHITFEEYINDPREVLKQLSECAFALAMYCEIGAPEPDLESTKKYGDVIKIRTYLACGLPIVVTDVPFSAREVSDNGAGIMTDYDKDEFVKAVTKLYNDPEFNISCRSAARKMATENMWERNYDRGMAGLAVPADS